jgi:hypothetical protein
MTGKRHREARNDGDAHKHEELFLRRGEDQLGALPARDSTLTSGCWMMPRRAARS